MKLVDEMLHLSAQATPDAIAVADPLEKVSYGVLSGEVRRLAQGLAALGVSPGDRVLLVLPNCVNFVRAHFAVLSARAISVPCEYGVTPANFQQITSNCLPKAVLTTHAAYHRLSATFAEHSALQVLLLDDRGTTEIPLAEQARTQLVSSLISTVNSDAAISGGSEEDVAAIMYTTGSTDTPKGVVLTHRNVLSAVHNISTFLGYSQSDKEVIILPLSHNFGLGHLYCNLLNQGAVYVEDGLSRIKRVLTAVSEFQATGFPGTPLGYGMLLDRYKPIVAETCKNLRFIVINSAPLPPDRTKELRELLPNTEILVYYGLTEASRSTFISLSSKGPEYYRSVGEPMPGVALKIVDAVGKELPHGKEGEIILKGPTVSRGYWNNEAATAAVFKNGWLHTGDLGQVNAQGILSVTGRLKDIINVGGYKVLPGEVEAVLRSCPGVLDAGVAGIENVGGLTGELVIAGLVVDVSRTFDPETYARHCLSSLEKFKVPVKFLPLESIPRSETGKVLRRELIKELTSRLETVDA